MLNTFNIIFKRNIHDLIDDCFVNDSVFCREVKITFQIPTTFFLTSKKYSNWFFFINDQILIRLMEWKTHYNQWFKPLRETTPITFS